MDVLEAEIIEILNYRSSYYNVCCHCWKIGVVHVLVCYFGFHPHKVILSPYPTSGGASFV